MRRPVMLCGVLSAVLACGGNGGEATDEPRRWLVDAVPVVDVADTVSSGDLVFQYASGATRLSNGAIVIGDGIGDAVHFLDSAGLPVQTVGREGRGPGEFIQITWLGQCGSDTVVVWDRMLGRFTVISAAGNVMRQYPLEDPNLQPFALSCSRTGVLALLGLPERLEPVRSDAVSPEYKAPLVLTDMQGGIIQTMGEVSAGESRPLGKLTRIAVSADRVYVGTQDSAFIDVYTLDGQRDTTLPAGIAGRRTTRRHYERAIDALVVWLARAADREAQRRWALDIPMPEHLPPYSAVLVDLEGLVWAVLSFPGDPETWLRAIDANGRVVSEVHLPQDLRVFEVGADYILGAYDEESGEPHVAMYRLHRDSQ